MPLESINKDELLQLLQANGLDEFDSEASTVKTSVGGSFLYPASLRWHEGILYCLARSGGEKVLLTLAKNGAIPSDTKGLRVRGGGVEVDVAEPGWESYHYLKKRFPFVEPVSLRQRKTTFGVGDRLGRATPGHIRAIRPFPASPVLAQQSIRELNLTGRSYEGVVADAAFGVYQEGFTSGWGADGDHVKTIDDIDAALDAEMPMITLDLTEVMDPLPSEWGESRVEEAFARLDISTRESASRYAGKSYELDGERVIISPLEARRCALMYWAALDFAREVNAHIRRRRGDSYDLEISIDETEAPTHPAHHLFIAEELRRREVVVNSVAPRFTGEFQKGIDYIGDVGEFDEQFAIHAKIARRYGYKVSVHSGSDKFSVYPAIGRHTGFRVHVKTAGTSWLEAIRTVAAGDSGLYRLMHERSFAHFDTATKLYHITSDLDQIPPLGSVADGELGRFLLEDASRQLLHISYGGLLNDPDVRRPFFEFIDQNEESYYATVGAHIRRHLEALGLPEQRVE